MKKKICLFLIALLTPLASCGGTFSLSTSGGSSSIASVPSSAIGDSSVKSSEVSSSLDSSAASSVQEYKYHLKVMSCNLDQASGGIKEKQEAVFNKMINVMPDLIGVQEETPAWESYLAPTLEECGYKHVYAFRGGSYQEASGIFYSIDRFTLKTSGTFWLADKNSDGSLPGAGTVATSWGALYPRVCTYVVLTDKVSKMDLAYFNTHLSYVKDVPVRVKSEQLIKANVDTIGLPSLLSGDLNFFREDEPATYKAFTDDFADSYAEAAVCDHGPTFHDYGAELTSPTHPSSPIDYIFHTKGDFMAEDFKIYSETGPSFYSDHFFISSKLGFDGKK